MLKKLKRFFFMFKWLKEDTNNNISKSKISKFVLNRRNCPEINSSSLRQLSQAMNSSINGLLCLRPQHKRPFSNQMSQHTMHNSFVLCMCSHSEQKSYLKRKYTSLVCVVYPGCTWSESSRPSPTPGV